MKSSTTLHHHCTVWNKFEQEHMGEKVKKKRLVVILVFNQRQCSHFSSSALYFSFIFKTYQRNFISKSAFCPGPVPIQWSNVSHWHIFKRENSFIRLLTLENFWSLKKDNSHSCYMADWPRHGCILGVPRVSGGLHLLPVLFSCHYSFYTASFCYQDLYLCIAQQDEEHTLIKYFPHSNRWCATLHYPGKLPNSS